MRTLALLALLGPLLPSVGAAQAQGVPPLSERAARPTNPPLLECDLPAVVTVGTEVRFTLVATDPDGDRVDVRLLNPPEGLVLAPARRASSPWVGSERWIVEPTSAGTRTLLFEAADVRSPERVTRLEVRVRVEGDATPSGIVTGDVTGDGVLDVVAASRSAVYLWAGGGAPSATPSATLAFGGLDLGSDPRVHLQLGDVTGDGVLDIVAAAPLATVGGVAQAGCVLVWRGGALAGSVAPHHVLQRAAPVASDRLGEPGVALVDLSGSGALDVVAASSLADSGGHADTGLLALWRGLPAGGASAELVASDRADGDRLGVFTYGASVQFADVTGDGVLDVVAGASAADPGGIVNAGAAYVWAGGAMAGETAPSATLRVPGNAQAGDRLGEGSRMLLVDVTGDGTSDVVVGNPLFDFTPSHDEGALHVWKGGPTLVGTLAPTATLADGLFATNQDRLGSGATTHGTEPFAAPRGGPLAADVTGDGIADLVARSSFNQDQGLVHVWAGSAALSGTVAQTMTCLAPSGEAGEEFGLEGIQTADLDGDGVADLVVSVGPECVGGALGAGAVHVWLGGPGLSGAAGPDATLQRADPHASDGLASEPSSVRFADVTGDGVDDGVVACAAAEVGGVPGAGAVLVFAGGPGLAGTHVPDALLAAPAAAPEGLGAIAPAGGTRSGLRLADVSGDGVCDVLVATDRATVGASANAGAVRLWRGGPGLAGAPAPDATLSVPGASAGDRLGLVSPAPGTLDFAQGLRLGDVTGDGVLDLVAGAALADAGATDAGAVHVWTWQTGWTGALTPDVTLGFATPRTSDQLGRAHGGQGLLLADLDGDGVLDVLAGASFADPGGVANAGAILVRASSAGALELSVPGAPAGDRLGY